jgi:biopolymer transport protein ExbB
MTIGMTRRLLVGVVAGCFVLALGQRALAQAAPAAEAAKPAAEAAKPAAGTTEPTKTVDPAKASGEGKVEAKMTFWEIVTRSGWFGILIWIGLIVCSVISVALIVDSYLTIQEKKIAPKSLVDDVRSSLSEGDLLKALQQCENNPVPLSRILKAGFTNAEEGFEVVQDAVGVAADMEGEKLLQRVTYLSVISNTTPMLGLIGTVQGMIFAFFNLGKMAAGAAQQAMLAINISHGLWATAVGLGTAVPAGIFFFYFKNRATRIILHMEALTLDLIKTLRNVEVVHE